MISPLIPRTGKFWGGSGNFSYTTGFYAYTRIQHNGISLLNSGLIGSRICFSYEYAKVLFAGNTLYKNKTTNSIFHSYASSVLREHSADFNVESKISKLGVKDHGPNEAVRTPKSSFFFQMIQHNFYVFLFH